MFRGERVRHATGRPLAADLGQRPLGGDVVTRAFAIARALGLAAAAVAASVGAGFTVAALTTGEGRSFRVPSTPPTPTVTAVVRDSRPAPGTVTDGRPGTAAHNPTRADARYIVKRGDTLWGIAASHYEDVASGMRRIKKRNGLGRDYVLAGEVLVLPGAGGTASTDAADS